MKFRSFFLVNFLLILSFSFTVHAQNLSENAEVSVITCAPGNELYSTFGHTAIRVKDPVYRFDKVYNYGTFNFETPNFYLKFGRGQLDYMLSVSPYKYFVISYMNENRWIKEQLLDLNYTQKKDIYIFLENNALPENKYYRYDFFYDNCATRVKDVVKNVLGDNLTVPESITEEGTSFRDMLNPYLKGKEWERFGINILLGHPANKIVTPDEASFLPDYTEIYFNKCRIKKDGNESPLVKDTRMLYEPENTVNSEGSNPFSPTLLFWMLFVLFIMFTFIEFRRKKYFIILDKALLYLFGIAGILILLFWFATEHKAVVNNWDIIWGMPLYLIVAFMLKRKGNKAPIRYFMFIWAFVLFAALSADLLFFDNLFDSAVIPLIMILLLRSPLIFFFRK